MINTESPVKVKASWSTPSNILTSSYFLGSKFYRKPIIALLLRYFPTNQKADFPWNERQNKYTCRSFYCLYALLAGERILQNVKKNLFIHG